MLQPSRVGPPLKVGIIRSSSIGDVVLATACIDLLEQLSMSVEITWLGRGPTLGLLKEAYPNIEIIDLSRYSNISEMVQLLGHLHFLIDLQTNMRSRFLGRAFKNKFKRPFFTCKKERIFRARLVMESRIRGRRRKLPSQYLKPPKYQFEMMAQTLKEALAEFLPKERFDPISNYIPHPKLPISQQRIKKPWEKELGFGKWLAIACGASYATKITPLKKLSNIINLTRDLMYQKYGEPKAPFGLVILGDHNDRAVSLELLDYLGWNDPFLNLTGQISLWEAAIALQRSAVILTNDSSLSHMAEAVGTPAAVLFGPTIESFGFAPWRHDSKAFSTLLGCRPCSKHGKTSCRFGDKLCFNSIRDEDIARHLLRFLDPQTE